MTHPLSLHHLVAPDVSPVELVRIAAGLGCPHVCLFTQDPAAGIPFPIVQRSELAELRAVMQGDGVTAWGLASFALTPSLAVANYRPALERGAQLGAARASIRVLDADEPRATANFAAFAALCAEHGITAGIEFTGFAAPDAFAQALRIVRACGGGLAVDALHLVRTGTPLAALAELAPGEISYVQLCDGPLSGTADSYAREGAFDRLAPGEGEFPLAEILGFVPAGLPLSLEVPCARWRDAGVPAGERAARVVVSTRRFLARPSARRAPSAG